MLWDPVFSSCMIPVNRLPSDTSTEKQHYAHLSVPMQFCFNDAEAPNCFKMLLCSLAILRGLTVNILRALRSTEGFGEREWRKIREQLNKWLQNRLTGGLKQRDTPCFIKQQYAVATKILGWQTLLQGRSFKAAIINISTLIIDHRGTCVLMAYPLRIIK